MMKAFKLFLILSVISLFSCQDDSFDNKFDQLPDERIQTTLKDYQETLIDAPFGWQLFYSLGGNSEYMAYQIAYFNEDNTLTLHSPDLAKPTHSEYRLRAEADIQLVFNTFNDNITVFSYPSENAPNGFGGDIEFNVKSVNEQRNEIILEGKVYKGKMILRKAKERFQDFAKLQEFKKFLNQQRTERYMNLAITSGLDGASEAKPYSIGLDLSSIAKVGDYAFNYKGEFHEGRKMLYFSHSGMGLSTPIVIDGHEIQFFRYNRERKRYEIANSDLEGYLYCTQLPVYSVPGVVDEFLDHYSLWMRASFGKVNQLYRDMKSENQKIHSLVIVTDYKRRIPKFDEKGSPILDASFNHDYDYGEKLGNGLLFSFESYEQFYFYFVPVDIEKLAGDRLRFKLNGKQGVCYRKGEKGTPVLAPEIAQEIAQGQKFQTFVNYLCSEKGWYIKRTVEAGQIDWDFVSQENPKNDYFYTRLK
ncbi:DUF4302 domain-containing protein [Ornithobacterium rhinotracheale]|uniref:DUF4302 domain-containing protein n=1 Tax=Ornithobacterium rhinotracheale TaxID=28251 RepID=A0A410JPT3_ORNRH|nr:DUF4302 domain-containing protein [Ornithobacterium rhinotracheale]QAR30144.1 DUF4302 domain-containing protein [Ornithobacterium rhinotracheale]